MPTPTLCTFVLEDPEGSLQAISEWAGSFGAASFEVRAEAQPGVVLINSEGRRAQAAAGHWLVLAVGGRYLRLRWAPGAAEVRVRVTPGAVVIDGVPAVGLYRAGATSRWGSAPELVCLAELPPRVPNTVRALTVLHGSCTDLTPDYTR